LRTANVPQTASDAFAQNSVSPLGNDFSNRARNQIGQRGLDCTHLRARAFEQTRQQFPLP
jgi:hypothetical protein